MPDLPLFPVTTVGSLPRPTPLLRALRAKRRGALSEAEFDRLADAAVLEALRLQQDAGVDIVTDGEQRRDNFYSFVSDKLEGVRLMSLAEMLDYVEDKVGFEKLLQTLDVPAYSINNPTCVGKIARRNPLAVEEVAFLKQHTDKPIKIPLPGPYLLTRAMWVPEITGKVYADKEALAEDVVHILREEAFALKEAGADFIQFDEPVLTELVFTQGQTRTFMCAALAARNDPTEELEFAVGLINRVVEGLEGVRTGLHVCRGNWSRDETTLLRGNYAPLKPWFARLKVQQLVLEYATPRAGDLMAFDDKELGLGVVNPRTDAVEGQEEILARVEEALQIIPKEKLFLNPDCGFGTFSARPMNEEERIRAKLRALSATAHYLRANIRRDKP
ncbi:MAG TPA: cobalamin-independent methionine synthase II family protein [Chthonomonadaceae bacterium]|nr:cobalamin-independent methionine synthase II family protein [Chthonomonadaceae bacterium]